MVEVAWNLNSLAFLALDKLKNVLLGLLNSSRLTSDLDLAAGGASRSLLGNIKLDVKLRLKGATSLATTSDEQAMLVRRNLKLWL